MNAPLPPNHHDAALMTSLPNMSCTSDTDIRSLLRDTAVLVTTLGPGGGKVHDATLFRDRCTQLIERFSNALTRLGYPDEVCKEVVIAQCGLLDETALRALPPESHAGWALKPLQVERFNLHDAGERVFEHLDARMRETASPLALLESYSAILGMGFVGRYAREGETKRTALMVSLNTQLAQRRPPPEQAFIIDATRRRLSDWVYQLFPWSITMLISMIAIMVWFTGVAVLDVQLAQSMSVKSLQP